MMLGASCSGKWILSQTNPLITIFLFSLIQPNVMAQSTRLDVASGLVFRSSNLNWSIAGNLHGRNPNILSELEFHNINAIGPMLQIAYRLSERFTLQLEGQQLTTYAGWGVDSDYAADNRQEPSFRELFSSDHGKYQLAASAILFTIAQAHNFLLQGGIFYQGDRQRYTLSLAEREVSSSVYSTHWQGAGLSLNLKFPIYRSLNIGYELRYSLVSYRAKGLWDIFPQIAAPLQFSQVAKGWGLQHRGTLLLPIGDVFSLFASLELAQRRTHAGVDRVIHLGEDNQEALVSTRFHGAQMQMFSSALGLRFVY